ncbi:MAG: NAD(P)/FAD-dependent oxidoreductase [Bacteroidota bacterium]
MEALPPDQQPINLIGGGLAGSLMAVYLAQKGFRVNVYERRADMRQQLLDGGRSINLALSERGIHALREVGLEEEIMEIAIPMYGRMMHAVDGSLTFQAYSKDQQTCIYSVSRAELNARMMNLSESLKLVDFFFEQRAEDIDFESGEVYLKDLATNRSYKAPGRVSIACDGAFSAVRYAMQKTPRFNLEQAYLDHGYKELSIPAGPDNRFQLEPNALHIWPRGSFMMIALPNLDGTFTCTLFLPFEGEWGFDALKTPDRVHLFFETFFPDALPLMPHLLDDFFNNPTGSLVTIRCYPWAKKDRILLMGDASHAIVPFFGQGMNAGFEDCSILNKYIDQHAPDWGKVFDEFQQDRKPNAEAIADMALENFIEMRDTVADPEFLLRKKVMHHLARHIPEFQSRYEWVSFSTIPYAEAYRRGQINDQIIDTLLDGISSLEEIDLQQAETLVKEMFAL